MIKKKGAILGIIVVALVIAVFAMQVLYYPPILDRLNSQVNTQQSQLDSKDGQISNLTSQIDNFQNQIDDFQSQISILQSNGISEKNELQDQITSLQSQLLDATALIAQLQGQSGILPTYMDLGWVGQDLNNGNYYLQLWLKNTGTVPITQIYVTLNSVQIAMTFTYLNTIVNADSPLSSYQTAIGVQDVTPPISHPDEPYPILIQAITTNGSIYTYQTTISSHV